MLIIEFWVKVAFWMVIGALFDAFMHPKNQTHTLESMSGVAYCSDSISSSHLREIVRFEVNLSQFCPLLKRRLGDLKGVSVVYKLLFASSTKRCGTILVYPEHLPSRVRLHERNVRCSKDCPLCSNNEEND
jgi:hypothetical protein